MKKTRRQAAILELIAQSTVSSQEELRHRLHTRGFDATQATLSRDVKDLGLVKRAADGAYQRATSAGSAPSASGPALGRAVAEYLTAVDRAQQLVVMKTGAGQAQPLAIALDRASLPEVVGTVAGDDTVLVICRNPTQAQVLVRRVTAFSR
jgi:transcriptional regulator of arginine metabolism